MPQAPFKSAKEALRWTLGLLTKAVDKLEAYTDPHRGDGALFKVGYTSAAHESRDLLSSIHAQAILIDELIRGYQ